MARLADLPRVLLIAVAATAAASAAAQEASEPDPLRSLALELVNEARAEAGLSALDLDAVLTEAAQSHASDMLERDYYAHVSPDGQTPFDRFLAAGGSRWAVSGENIARCSGCAAPADAGRVRAFQTGWMQSPEHRANILSEGFDRLGFGIAGEGDEIYAVQTFAGPGEGPEDGGAGLTPDEARAAALEAVNGRRDGAGLAGLQPSADLDAVAAAVLERRLADQPLPDDLFGLLPDGASGWTSLGAAVGQPRRVGQRSEPGQHRGLSRALGDVRGWRKVRRRALDPSRLCGRGDGHRAHDRDPGARRPRLRALLGSGRALAAGAVLRLLACGGDHPSVTARSGCRRLEPAAGEVD